MGWLAFLGRVSTCAWEEKQGRRIGAPHRHRRIALLDGDAFVSFQWARTFPLTLDRAVFDPFDGSGVIFAGGTVIPAATPPVFLAGCWGIAAVLDSARRFDVGCAGILPLDRARGFIACCAAIGRRLFGLPL